MIDTEVPKQMDFGEILDATFTFFGQNLLQIVSIFAVFYIPLGAVTYFFYVKYIEMMKAFYASAGSTNFDPSVWTAFTGAIGGLSIALILLALIAKAAIVRMVDYKLTNGENMPMGELLAAPFKKLFALIVAALAAYLMILAGTVLCVIPGLILAVYLAFVTQSVMLGNKGPFGSIGDSFRAVKGNFWQVVLIAVLLYLMWSLVYGIVLTPFTIVYFAGLFKDINLNMSGLNQDETIRAIFQNFNGSGALIVFVAVSTLASAFYGVINTIAMTIKYRNALAVRNAGTKAPNE